MIYTVTLNPAIDYTVKLDELKKGCINRCSAEHITFGGKGINVSAILNELGLPTKVLGFCAGFTGQAIEQGLEKSGIPCDFVHLSSGNTRINVKIIADEETQINGSGQPITQQELEHLFAKLDQIADGDVVVLGGSIPSSVPNDIYEQILERLSGKDVKTVVDAEGQLLAGILRYRPFLIKPNTFELEQLFGEAISCDEQVYELAQSLHNAGAANVLVSMAQNGSMLIDGNDDMHRQGVCTGEVISSVGAGDSMVAGFIAGYLKTGDYDFSLKLGTACGGATAFSQGTAKRELILELFKQLR